MTSASLFIQPGSPFIPGCFWSHYETPATFPFLAMFIEFEEPPLKEQ